MLDITIFETETLLSRRDQLSCLWDSNAASRRTRFLRSPDLQDAGLDLQGLWDRWTRLLGSPGSLDSNVEVSRVAIHTKTSKKP